MIDRRTFSALLAGTVAMPSTSFGQSAAAKAVLYQSVGPELSVYAVDAEKATLTKHSSASTPSNIQYVWPHPSKTFLYTVSSDQGSGNALVKGKLHVANAFRIDPATGALTPHGEPRHLATRPIHASVDRKGEYLLTAYNNPSSVTVHRINPDGTLGGEIAQPEKLDTGVFAHQILTTPDNSSAILVTRGNNAERGKAEDPGALKAFTFKGGALRNAGSIAPGAGLGFGPRHVDFHPTEPWVFVSVERQSQLHVFKLQADGVLAHEPMHVQNSLAEPGRIRGDQMAGAIHVHPNGRFVYQTNRNSTTIEDGGNKVFGGGENNIAVFSIDPQTGAPTRIQNIDAHTNHLRTFSIHPSGKLLVAAGIRPIKIRDGSDIKVLPAAMVVYSIGDDGKLAFVHKYDVDTGDVFQWWSGFVSLA
jgi:6-phosphogluconolactonase (cycloisomerase 2 family)